MSSLHVAVDCRVVDPHYPGIGRATLETVRALTHQCAAGHLSLLVGPGTPPPELAALARAPGVELVRLHAAPRAPANQWDLPRVLGRLRPDVYHATYYAVPALLPGRVVVTVYDLIPRLFPHYWPGTLTRLAINGWTAYAARRATRVIACSQSTANDLARLLPGVAGKVSVVPLGVSARAVPAHVPAAVGVRYWSRDAHGGTPFLLYIGSNKPHKNLPRLVAAFARIAPHVDGNLLIAGAWDGRYPEARDEARRRGLTGRVIFEPQPSDARLEELYGSAVGLVFPSRYEGFGLPVLEAMAAGLPVATSDRGSLREVAGDAALLFDPDDEAAMAEAMRRLLGDVDLRVRLAAQGRARAALFPWSRTASATWAVYEEAVSQGARAVAP